MEKPKTMLSLQSEIRGRLAQLVQSTWFTPKGSGVRIPCRPQNKKILIILSGFFLFYIFCFTRTHDVSNLKVVGFGNYG